MQKLKNKIISIFLLLLFCVNAHSFELYGDAVQGAMLVGKAKPNSKIVFDGISETTGKDGIFVIGLHRSAPKKMKLKINNETYYFDVQQRKYLEQRINGLPNKKVNPPKSLLKRIKKENDEIKKSRKIKTDKLYFTKKWVHPTKGKITGVYGSRRILNGKPKFPHYGIDYANKTGTPVIAPQNGKVIMIQENNFYSGKTIIIEHGKGINTAYLHLQKIYVKVGQELKQGQKIGAIGTTGRSTGPHLDWRINWYDKRLDPALLTGIELGLNPTGKNVDFNF